MFGQRHDQAVWTETRARRCIFGLPPGKRPRAWRECGPHGEMSFTMSRTQRQTSPGSTQYNMKHLME